MSGLPHSKSHSTSLQKATAAAPVQEDLKPGPPPQARENADLPPHSTAPEGRLVVRRYLNRTALKEELADLEQEVRGLERDLPFPTPAEEASSTSRIAWCRARIATIRAQLADLRA